MKDKLSEVIQSNVFVHGLGCAGYACTVGVINLAIKGKVTDDRPDSMCPVLHAFVIPLQDAMPHDLLNSQRWRYITYRLARSKADEAVEKARMDLITGWLWGTALPQLKPIAEKNGFWPQWQHMLEERTADAARRAAAAAAARWAATLAASAAARTDVSETDYWQSTDPCGLMERLLNVQGGSES